MKSRVLTTGILVLSWGIPFAAQAQRFSLDAALHTSEKPYVQASGEATISVKPDQALVEIGVISQGSTAMAVSAQNARQTDAVLADLARVFGGSKKLRTTNYSVRPNYQYPKPGAAAAIAGFTATNIVEVTVDDLNQVSKVIDTATQSGANVIQKLQYRLKSPSSVRGQALRAAAEEAKVSVEAIASGLGLKVIRVLSAEEVMPEEGFGMKKMAPPPPPSGTTPATPLEIGTIEVTVNVIVRAEIGIYGVADHIGSITVGASAEIEIWRRERKMAYSTRPEGRPPVRRTPLSRTHTIKKQWACQRSGGSWL